MSRIAGLLVFGLVATATLGVRAQTPPKPTPAAKTPTPGVQAPAPPPQTHAAVPAPAARLTVALTVTDASGTPIPGVRVMATGPVSREGTTAREGSVTLQTLRAGTYRLRFEADDFVTLERELTLKPGAPAHVDVTLGRAPARPVPPPVSAPVPAPTGTKFAPNPDATVDVLALPDWIEKNYIGRNDPRKETTVGRAPGATATVLQVREPIRDRVHDDVDEVLYVIAGEGVLRAKGHEQSLDAGACAIIPRGVSYSVERRGKNPLIALSVLSSGK